MSDQITLVKARERLYARLWPDETPLDDDQRLAIAEHRLWQTLQERRFHASVEGDPLGPGDMTEAMRRSVYTRLPAVIIDDASAFETWLASLSSLTAVPNAPYMTAVEAALFLAYGAFVSAAVILTQVAD